MDVFGNIGVLITFFNILIVICGIIAVVKGFIPVFWRLGKGLACRKIAIFAEDNTIKNLLIDSKLFKEKNICMVSSNEIKKANDCSIKLVHWKSFKQHIGDIKSVKKHSDALIIYAPREEGSLTPQEMNEMNSEQNTILVNFRGRLLNDVIVTMIATGYSR
jgi:hypothetical protein